jgi:hypothetical protein
MPNSGISRKNYNGAIGLKLHFNSKSEHFGFFASLDRTAILTPLAVNKTCQISHKLHFMSVFLDIVQVFVVIFVHVEREKGKTLIHKFWHVVYSICPEHLML